MDYGENGLVKISEREFFKKKLRLLILETETVALKHL